MSEFQISLLAIGAVAVIAVFAYNKWQEYRVGRAADEAFKSRHPDFLIDEPGTPVPATGSASGDDPGNEPTLSTKPEVVAPVVSAEYAGPVVPNASVDYVIELTGDRVFDPASLTELWADVERRFASNARLAGLVDGQWVPMGTGATSDKLTLALQLVSRKGVLEEGELLEFGSAAQMMAAKIHFVTKAPEVRDALKAARALDKICAQADIQVAFHVVAETGAAFAGTKVRAAAEAAGFVLDARQRFFLSDEQGRELYELADRSGVKFVPAEMKNSVPQALTLSMDVPRAPDTQRTFEAMVRFGRHLAKLLGGALVDDNNQPLDARAIAAINAQLLVVRRNLEAQGIAPGSALALRLFS